MTKKQSKAETISTTGIQIENRSEKQVTPPFRALGIPALAAATRSAPRASATAPRELPHFLRHPHGS